MIHTPSSPLRGLPADPGARDALLAAVRPGALCLFTGRLALGKETAARALARAAGLGEAPWERQRGIWEPSAAPFVLAEANHAESLASIDRALAAGMRVFAINHSDSVVDGLLCLRHAASSQEVADRLLDATTAAVGMQGFAPHPCPACSVPAPDRPGTAFAGFAGARDIGRGCPACSGPPLADGAIDRSPAMEVLCVDATVRDALREGDAARQALRDLLHPPSGHGRMAAAATRAAGTLRFWTREQDLRLRVAAGAADVAGAEHLLGRWARVG